MSETSHTSRITSFKNTAKGTTDLRRKRAELSVALRKQARDDQILKRRAMSPEGGVEDQSQGAETLPSIEEIVRGLKSDDLAQKTVAARAARRILSREQNPPISKVVAAGCIKPLVDALDRDDWAQAFPLLERESRAYSTVLLQRGLCLILCKTSSADLQFEAAWALTNIASGSHDHTMAVVEGGAVPKLVSLLGRGGSVAEQSAWALGNVAGDGAHPRDAVLAAGALPALLPLLIPGGGASQLRTAVWTYSNLCRNKNPLVKFDIVAPALPFIADLLEVTDHDVLADACWAISYLTDGPNDRIEAVQNTPGLLARLVKLLDHGHSNVRSPALRAVGNMVTGSDAQTDRCISAGCLPKIAALLRCGRPSLVKEAAWAASNVLAGTEQQIQSAIDAGLLDHLVHVVANEEPKSQKEAAWAITNLCLGGNGPQLAALLASGFLEPYCHVLAVPDARTVTVVLDGLHNLLQAAEKFGEVEQLCIKLEEIGALDKIEALQNHENELVYKKALHILEKYFAEGEDLDSVPTQSNDEFQFGPANHNIDF